VKMGAVMKRSILGGLRILLALAACGLVVFAASDAWTQQKQKYLFKAQPGVSKYTQQLAIDVGDVPGHQVRVLELYSNYTGEAPVYSGVKVKEGWLRTITEYRCQRAHHRLHPVCPGKRRQDLRPL
jgi:hypothetical protein